MSKKKIFLLISLILILALAGGWYFYANSLDSSNDNTSVQEEFIPKAVYEDGVEEIAEYLPEDITDLAMTQSGGKVAVLTDVSGGNSSGTAYLSSNTELFFLSADAALPAPSSGTFYEGWLVGDPAKGEILYTGPIFEFEGVWKNIFYGDLSAEYQNYTQYVVTLETVDDQKPEKHIIEGTFN